MVAKGFYNQFIRIRAEDSFNAANPERLGNWYQGYGLTGLRDLYDSVDGDGLVPNLPLIFPTGKSGDRGLNASKPVPGGQDPALGTLEIPFYPELSDPLIYGTLSNRTLTPTAGTAALVSTSFATLATLDTQPTDPEILAFTFTGSSTSSGAIIEILVDAVVVESIAISDTDHNLTYHSQGAYGPTVTFTTQGTNDGSVSVSGISYSTIRYTLAQDTPSFVIEQAGRIEVDETQTTTTSEFFPGVKFPTQSFAFDRTDNLSLLMQTVEVNGLFPTTAPSSSFDNAAALYYRPMAAWFGTVTVKREGDPTPVTNKEITGAVMNINSGDEHFPVASGSRGPDNAVAGWFESFGDLTLVPQSKNFWDDHVNGAGFQLHVNFVSIYEVAPGVPYSIKFKYEDAYIETYTRGSQGAAMGGGLTFRSVYSDVNLGPAEIEVVSRLPV